MRRGPKPTKSKEAKPPVARKSPKDDGAKIRDLEKRLAEALKRETEALERETATSGILRIISNSPTDTQPVFDAIADSAMRLFGAWSAVVLRYDGEFIRLAAARGGWSSEKQLQRLQRPRRPSESRISGPAILTRTVRQIVDVETDASLVREIREIAREVGWRSAIYVPMLRGDDAVGAIGIHRAQPGAFSSAEIPLLQTFADQAVIAIENVRLFTELQEKNRALTEAHAQVTEALEQQTATSEILRVISSSPTDVRPVFSAVAGSAARLCEAQYAGVMLVEDGNLVIPDLDDYGIPPEQGEFLRRLGRIPIRLDLAVGRAVIEGAVQHVDDVLANGPLPDQVAERIQRALAFRTFLAVPMRREGLTIGVMVAWRTEPRPFTATQIALVQTFADQAVIAIENVRLFTELQLKNQALTQAHAQVTQALEQQTATADILKVISGSPTDVQPVFDAIAESAARLCSANDAQVLRVEDGNVLRLIAAFGTPSMPPVRQLTRGYLIGRAVIDRKTLHVRDLAQALAEYPETTGARFGVQSALAVPLLREGVALGVIRISRTEIQPFTDEQIALVQTFADQAVIAIENVRLFKELEVANRELEAASQHKSEFLANMSHELRTPLNAIIGFSEVLSEKMFGELNEKQQEYSTDIHASGQHLLSLINDILDLSKIEAGRMELELTDFDLPTAIENALMLVRERAGRRSIALHTNIDKRLGQIQADERKVRQVVLNLLSNAIKFTPEGGRIDVAATPKDGLVEVSVRDTGVGIAPDDQEKVFEEFRQVGTAAKKVEGTGLGLTLCRKFVELHGGRIWVKSEVGEGSTFTFTIPVRHGE